MWLKIKRDSPETTPQDVIAMLQRFNAKANRDIRELRAELDELLLQERSYR